MIRRITKTLFVIVLAWPIIAGVSCTDDETYVPPSVPSAVSASDGEFATGVLISWKEAPGALVYYVYRSDSPDGFPGFIGLTTNTFYNDTSAEAGVTYYYSVASENISSISQSSVKDAGTRAQADPVTWTIMIYLDADNNLDYYGVDDFEEMMDGFMAAYNKGSMGNLDIIVLFDRWEDQEIPDWHDTRLYRIGTTAERLEGNGFFDAPITATSTTAELNMGDQDTLYDFIRYCKTYYPADHYALVLWNHGEGVRSTGGRPGTSSVKSVCIDDSHGDSLYLEEIQQALGDTFSSSDKLDIIAFDACLMGMVEVAYEFRSLADYFVASMNYVQLKGWDYERLFSNMHGNMDESLLTPADLSFHVVDSYRSFITSTLYDSGQTMTAVKLWEMEQLKASIDSLATVLNTLEHNHHLTSDNSASPLEEIRDASYHFYESNYLSIYYPYYDLYDLCTGFDESGISSSLSNAAQDVVTSLGSAILWTFGQIDSSFSIPSYAGSGASAPRGLSILFPRGNRRRWDTSEDSYVSYYFYDHWYTSYDISGSEEEPGQIDFCTYDSDTSVESWLELFEAWYDPYGENYSSY